MISKLIRFISDWWYQRKIQKMVNLISKFRGRPTIRRVKRKLAKLPKRNKPYIAKTDATVTSKYSSLPEVWRINNGDN